MELKYKRKNVYKEADGNELEKIYGFAEGYKNFWIIQKPSATRRRRQSARR